MKLTLRSHRCGFFAAALVAACFGLALSHAAEPKLELKDNDVWVMAGDSITAQRLHTNYIEAFFRTRYPELKLHFRNSGISGNRTPQVLQRFDYDVAAWKPTIVSVELGMNDVGGADPAKADCADGYVAGMKGLADRIRAINAQPIFISSSPVNDGSLMNAWTSRRCQTIHPFTVALAKLAGQESILVVDQYHPLIDLWGSNKTIDDVNSLAARIRLLKPENNIPELKTLQAFANAWETKPTVELGGDAVHPGPVGQYMMAAAILAELDVDREVSSATLKADGKLVSAKDCKITEITAGEGRLSFSRLDESGPWPLDPACADALKLMPGIADLSRYSLTILDLPDGRYNVAMDGRPVATLSNKELAAGWNMGPQGERSTKILALVQDLQGNLNNAWRAASKEKDEVKLAAAQQAIEKCEAELQAACQPVPIRFEITPAS